VISNEDLVVRAQAGEAWAKEQIVLQNTKFVLGIARKYHRWCRMLDLDDLVSVGQIGLLLALDKFDVRRGFRFLTYAAWWVRQSIAREVMDKDLNIRIPARLQEAARQIYVGKAATRAAREEVQRADLLRQVWSLDAPVGEGRNLGETVAGENDRSIEDEVQAAERAAKIREAVGRLNLSVRDQAIVEQRLMGDATLFEVADQFGICRERIRQLEVVLRGKLRTALKEFAP
jgi:RNA polymerase sigma factor (sigma-70 family)